MSSFDTLEDLKITSDPIGAEVCINGELKGKTPLNIAGLKGGTHRLKITKKGYQPIMRDVRLPHKSQKLFVRLRAKGTDNEAVTSYG